MTSLSEATQFRKYEIAMESQESMQSEAQDYVKENLYPKQTMRGRKIAADKYLLQNALCIF